MRSIQIPWYNFWTLKKNDICLKQFQTNVISQKKKTNKQTNKQKQKQKTKNKTIYVILKVTWDHLQTLFLFCLKYSITFQVAYLSSLNIFKKKVLIETFKISNQNFAVLGLCAVTVGEMVLLMADRGSNGTLWDRKDVSLSLLFESTVVQDI